MSAPKLDTVRSRIESALALAGLLERVERGPSNIGADRYRTLVRQLQAALQRELPDEALQAVLGAYPAAAEVYENLHYAQSGLSRSSLERSVSSEMLASQALARAARRP
jgi:hypothetical protein